VLEHAQQMVAHDKALWPHGRCDHARWGGADL